MSTHLPPPPPPIGPPPQYGGPPQPGWPPGSQYSHPLATASYAGWWRRVGAYWIDATILSVALGAVQVFVSLLAPRGEPELCEVGGQIRMCETVTDAGAAMILMAIVLVVAGYVAYYAVLEGRRGQTIGKMAVSIRVVDADTGGPVGIGRGIGRFFARILSSLPLMLGYLWPLWDKRKQTFHDKLVNCCVIRTDVAGPPGGWDPTQHEASPNHQPWIPQPPNNQPSYPAPYSRPF